MTRVKICGVNSAAAFDTAVAGGADWVGFVFFPPSPRAVTAGQAAALSARAPGGPARVGLFVDPSEAQIADVLAQVPLDMLQVYGRADLAALAVRFGLPVWRPVGIAARPDLPDRPPPGASALVIETKAPPGASRPGGNAQTFDWSLLAGWAAPLPWLLAGGLTPQTVGAAIRATGAAAVDVSSGVEREPGVKDSALIRAFLTNARAAEGDR